MTGSTPCPRGSRSLRSLVVLVTVVLVALAGPPGRVHGRPPAAAADARALPRVAVTGTYVAGVSSGGYLATQLQVAHSRRILGAGVFAAGPYWCAMGSLALALHSCTAGRSPVVLATRSAAAHTWAASGAIDPTAYLRRSRTWLFHGAQDRTVVRSVADDLAAWYRSHGVPLTYRRSDDAGHAWLSPLGPVACGRSASPYIASCPPYDAQADMLRTWFGSVRAPNPGPPRGTVTAFPQDPYAVPPLLGVGDVTRRGAAAIGMGRTGYVYTPAACSGGASCSLVVALHGCEQTAEQIGTTFVERSGLQAYADTNAFVVLYPQARPDAVFGNPKGCWDWWGYLGPADGNYATRFGPQVATVMAMVTALGG